jgi:hypothetical protein
MGLKGYRLWAMGQLDSTCRAPPLPPRLASSARAICPSTSDSTAGLANGDEVQDDAAGSALSIISPAPVAAAGAGRGHSAA